MKKHIFILLIIVIITSCTSAVNQSNKNILSKKTTVYGQILNPKSEKISLITNKNRKTTTIDSDGKFKLIFELKKEGKYTFLSGSEGTTIFLTPGNSLNIRVDALSFDESIEFKGKDKEINNYLTQKLLIEKSFPPNVINVLNENEFIKTSQEIYDLKKRKLYEIVPSTYEVLKSFIRIEKTVLLYEWAMLRAYYPLQYKVYTKNNITLSKKYNDYLKSVNLNYENNINIKEYRDFLDAIINTKTFLWDSPKKEITSERLKYKLNLINSSFKKNKVKNSLYYKIINTELRHNGLGIGLENLLFFRKNCSDINLITKIEDAYNKWEKLDNGNYAPVFKFKDANEQLISLEDFKGQYVYIDVWASWCKPCIEELPFLDKVATKFKDKNIKFVGISLDKDQDTWKNTIESKQMNGIQLFVLNGWKSEFVKNYNISSIPRYMLIDPQGIIIDAKMTRPSTNLENILNNMNL